MGLKYTCFALYMIFAGACLTIGITQIHRASQIRRFVPVAARISDLGIGIPMTSGKPLQSLIRIAYAYEFGGRTYTSHQFGAKGQESVPSELAFQALKDAAPPSAKSGDVIQSHDIHRSGAVAAFYRSAIQAHVDPENPADAFVIDDMITPLAAFSVLLGAILLSLAPRLRRFWGIFAGPPRIVG